jgi:hypothetical protein
MKNVGPSTYVPNFNSVLKTGPSKKMLGKSIVGDKQRDQDWPGPGQYQMPSMIKVPEPADPFVPTESRKKASTKFPGPGHYNQNYSFKSVDKLEVRQGQPTSEKIHGKFGKQAHFGTSTREGTTIDKFDEND